MIETEEEIYLNEVTHQYFHNSGKEFISVTNSFDKIGITDFSKIPFDVIEPARVKGDYVHQIAEYYGLGALDEESVDMAYKGYLEAVKMFFKEQVKEVVAIEKIVFSKAHGFAGKPDIVYINFKDELCVGDHKTPIKIHPATRWQLAPYVYAWEKMNKVKVDRRHAIQFKDDGEYEIHEFTNPLRRDFSEFITILRAAILKIENKIK